MDSGNILAQPEVETTKNLHISAKSNEDGATERVDCVLPPDQILDVEQRPAELVAIALLFWTQPSSDTGQHGSSVFP